MSVKSMVSNMSNTISGLSSPSRTNDINDYQSANYYNFYRILERGNKIREIGLIGNSTSSISLPPTYILPQPIRNLNDTPPGKTFILKEFTIDSEILDTCVTSCWTQNYINESITPIEAKYSIPLHPSSVVSSFTIEYKDKILYGKIKEKQRATEIYSDSIASGGQAFLASKSDDGFFSFSLGNIPPKESVVIRLTIQSEIGTHLESLHYCLHKSIFPQTTTPDFKFNLSIKISLSNKIKNIKFNDGNTFTKGIKIEYLNTERTKSLLTYENDITLNEYRVPKNLVTIIELDDTLYHKPNSCIEYNPIDKTYAVSLNFYPKFQGITQEDVNQKSEFIFVIDCSGSMSGDPIKKAKRAMEIIIRSLNEQCKFNIYCFGSSYTKAFSQSKVYNDESLVEITGYVDRISANLGGTQLFEPIQNILSQEVDLDYPRQVFILTDGSISNRDVLIDYVAKESGTTRMFTLGIGNAVDTELVVGLSKACRGYYELINNNSNMEVEVLKLLSIAFEPTLSNISFDWGVGYHDEATLKTSVIVAPAITRPIFNNERMMTYALIDYNSGEFTTPINVVMNCNGPLGNKLSYSMTLDLTNKSSIDTESTNIHTLAAHKHIQDLEDLERKSSAINKKDEIVKFGKKYNIVSKHTSFVVTCESDEVTNDTMKSVDIFNKQEREFTTIPNYNLFLPSSSISYQQQYAPSPPGCPPPFAPSISYQQQYAPPPPGGSHILPNARTFAPMRKSMMSTPSQSVDRSGQDGMKIMCNVSTDMVFKSPQSFNQSELRSSSTSRSSSSGGNTYKIAPNSQPTTNDHLLLLLKLQSANGSWKNSVSQPMNTMGVNFTTAMENIPTEFVGTPDVWITLLVISKILKDFSKCKDQWEMVVNKSNKWIKSQILALGIEITKFDSFLTIAKNFV